MKGRKREGVDERRRKLTGRGGFGGSSGGRSSTRDSGGERETWADCMKQGMNSERSVQERTHQECW